MIRGCARARCNCWPASTAAASAISTRRSKDGNPDIRITGLRIARALKLDVIPCVKALVQDQLGPGPPRMRHRAPAQSLAGSAQTLGAARPPARRPGPLVSRSARHRRRSARGPISRRLAGCRRRQMEHSRRSRHHLAFAQQENACVAGQNHHSGNLSAQERDHYFRSLDFITGPEKDAALVELLTAK